MRQRAQKRSPKCAPVNRPSWFQGKGVELAEYDVSIVQGRFFRSSQNQVDMQSCQKLLQVIGSIMRENVWIELHLSQKLF